MKLNKYFWSLFIDIVNVYIYIYIYIYIYVCVCVCVCSKSQNNNEDWYAIKKKEIKQTRMTDATAEQVALWKAIV